MSSYLVRARRAWKRFTSKLQRKLQKFHPHHIINNKKPRHNNNSTPRLLVHCRCPFKPSHRRRGGRTTQALRQLKYSGFKRQPWYSPPPIFIDDLFRLQAEGLVASLQTGEKPESSIQARRPRFNSTSTRPNPKKKKAVVAAPPAVEVADQGNQQVESRTKEDLLMRSPQSTLSSAPDEMRESMELTSHHAKGVDDRAEEFIRRFRAELQFQEMIASFELSDETFDKQ